MPKLWSQENINILKRLAGTKTDEQIGKILNMSRRTVQKKRQRLGIKKDGGRGRDIRIV